MKVGIITQYENLNKSEEAKGELSGVATFSHYLYKDYSENDDLVVIANYINKPSYVREGQHKIAYCWKKGNKPFKEIYKMVCKEKLDVIHIHHELFLYGNIFENINFLLFLLKCKIKKIKIIIEFHAVLSLKKINTEFTESNRIKFPPSVVKVCFLFMYKICYYICNSLIVHEDLFKTLLVQEYHMKENKINIIQLPCINPDNIMNVKEAKKKLNIASNQNMILYIGYISGYKGIDTLINASKIFLNSDDKILFLGGGLHPRLKNEKDYIQYVEDLKNSIVKDKTIWYGYVPDEELETIFSAADLVVFPYTIGMASSGPLSQTIAYEKPFIVSNAFRNIITERGCFYGNGAEELSDTIEKFFRDDSYRNRLCKYSLQLKQERTPHILCKKLHKIYN